MTNVSSTKADGAYPAGTSIPVTVTFSENVTVTGTPTLALNSGGTATYSSGSGGTTLTFAYTVGARRQHGRPRLPGDELARTLGRHDQGRRDQQRDAHPARQSAAPTRSAARRRSSSTRATRPRRVTTPASNGLTYNASSLPATLAGSSADTGGSSTVSTVQVAIQDGAGNYWGGATFNQGSIFYNATGGTTAAWTYSTATLAGQLTDGHTYTITARSTDAAGNTGTTTRTFVYDTTAPTVTNVTASNADGAYTTGQVIHVQVSFDEPVAVTGTPTLTLNTAPARTADYASGSGTSTLTFDYTIQSGDVSADLDYATTGSLALAGGTIKDAATNSATLTLPDGRRRLEPRRPEEHRDRHGGADRRHGLGLERGRRVSGRADDPRRRHLQQAGHPRGRHADPRPQHDARPRGDLRVGLRHRDLRLRLHGAGRRHVRPARRGSRERAPPERRDDPRRRRERRGHHRRRPVPARRARSRTRRTSSSTRRRRRSAT